jgi:CheY-like chemotaxis protein
MPRLVALRVRYWRTAPLLVGWSTQLSDAILLLLVEDEPLISLAAHDGLEAGGFTLVLADDGEAALQVLESRHQELSGLITDVRLGSGPNGLGYRAACQRTQARPAGGLYDR